MKNLTHIGLIATVLLSLHLPVAAESGNPVLERVRSLHAVIDSLSVEQEARIRAGQPQSDLDAKIALYKDSVVLCRASVESRNAWQQADNRHAVKLPPSPFKALEAFLGNFVLVIGAGVALAIICFLVFFLLSLMRVKKMARKKAIMLGNTGKKKSSAPSKREIPDPVKLFRAEMARAVPDAVPENPAPRREPQSKPVVTDEVLEAPTPRKEYRPKPADPIEALEVSAPRKEYRPKPAARDEILEVPHPRKEHRPVPAAPIEALEVPTVVDDYRPEPAAPVRPAMPDILEPVVVSEALVVDDLSPLIEEAARQGMSTREISRRYQVSADQVALQLALARKN